MIRRFLFPVIFIASCLWPAASTQAQSTVIAEFSVDPGRLDRYNEPIRASLQGVTIPISTGKQLFEITGGLEIPVPSQVEAGSPGYLTWILEGETRPGVVRNYQWRTIEEGASSAGGAQLVSIDNDGENLQVRIGDQPVLSYRYGVQDVPEGVDDVFARGGFIHPLRSPEGAILTRIQPPDHYHHYGLWNPWTSTEYEGREIDFWNLGKGQGTVRAQQIFEQTGGYIHGRLKALHQHIDFAGPSGEQVALNEQWEVRVWNADPDQKLFLIDIVSTLNPSANKPLTIKAYRYQGFSLRATEIWDDETASLLTSEGFDKSNGNATRARWIDVNGTTDTQAGSSGILFLTHPANHNYPEHLRIWPVGANNGAENVFINFNPAQENDWVLQPGQSYTLQYRMLVYDGQIDAFTAERYWRNYVDPPRVDVHPMLTREESLVLIYTKNGEGYVHDNIPASVEALNKLGDENGFAVEVSEDPGLFTHENLRRYDAVIFSNTNNDVFDTDEQRQAFQAYIRNGGGFVGIHSASGSERTWPWFSQLLGGNFFRHAPSQDFTVEVIDRAHPSTSFLSHSWIIENDECYYLKELNPGIKTLLAVDLTSVTDEGRAEYPADFFGDHFPISWYQTFDGGRQWNTSLGHRPEQYRDPVLMKHILGGILWVINGTI